ncbi:MAG: TIGR02679 family protein [Phycisphaeraceae bacterium]
MRVDEPRVRQTLGTPELAWLVDRLRRRYERGQTDANGVLRLLNPSPREREACDRLLGRCPVASDSISVRIDQLEHIVVSSGMAPNLRQAIETLTGPLIDRRSEAERERAAWMNLFDRFRSDVQTREAVASWYEQVREQGVLRRLSGGDVERGAVLLEQAVRVVGRLPAGGVTLAQLAAECCGDSHALDHGQPVGTLAVRAAAALAGHDQWRSASARRRAWDAVRVICDELSAPALALNLPGAGTALTDQLLTLGAQAGEPCRLTSRQLLRRPPTFDADTLTGGVFVCENANVVAAAADALGPASQPLVCIDGQPTTAATLLLELLSSAGITLRYHGDFDWGGIRIANRIISEHRAKPWRMSAADYLAVAGQGGRELRGDAVPAKWDDQLSTAMQTRGVAIHEERVVTSLIADLRSSAAFPEQMDEISVPAQLKRHK